MAIVARRLVLSYQSRERRRPTYVDRVINADADRAAYRQLADILRTQIADGLYDATQTLPSADGIARQHHVGKAVAEAALDVLRAEGWITKIGRAHV